MADGERDQECCKIKLSDLKPFSQGQALSHPMPWGREDGASGTNRPWTSGVGNRNRNRGWRAGGALRRGMRSRARSLRPADLPCRSLSHGPWIPEAHKKSPGTAKTYVNATTRYNDLPEMRVLSQPSRISRCKSTCGRPHVLDLKMWASNPGILAVVPPQPALRL